MPLHNSLDCWLIPKSWNGDAKRLSRLFIHSWAGDQRHSSQEVESFLEAIGKSSYCTSKRRVADEERRVWEKKLDPPLALPVLLMFCPTFLTQTLIRNLEQNMRSPVLKRNTANGSKHWMFKLLFASCWQLWQHLPAFTSRWWLWQLLIAVRCFDSSYKQQTACICIRKAVKE